MKHFLNGVEIPIRDLENIGFRSNWSSSISMDDRDSRELSLNVENVTLPNEAKDIINNWINTVGVFQGILYQIQLSNGQTIQYYIDLMHGQTKYREKDITVTIKRNKGFDNFFDHAQGSTFSYLASKGVIFDTLDIPYIVQPPNIIELGLSLGLTEFTVIKALIDGVLKLSELLEELVCAFIPAVGVGVVIVVGNITLALIKVILYAIYVISLIVAVIKMGQKIFELIFPKVRNFKGCKVQRLLEQSCDYYGYTFKSSVLSSLSGLTILPVPLSKSKKKGFKSVFDYIANDLNFAFTNGYPTSSDTTPTIWSLISELEKDFNLECRCIGNVVYLEDKSFFINGSTLDLGSPMPLQDSRQDEYSLNVDDTWKRYYIHYQPDYSDLNTLDNFDSTNVEYSTEAVNILDKNLVTIKGLQDRSINFSLATRKSKLNWVEKTTKEIAKIIDKLANTNLVSQINNRIGVLTLTNQFFMNTKLMYTINGKQPENFNDYISAQNLWSNYHTQNEIQNNGYKIKEGVKFLMNEELYVNLLNNNFVTINGKICELITVDFKPYRSEAIITYKEPFDYATGKVNTILING